MTLNFGPPDAVVKRLQSKAEEADLTLWTICGGRDRLPTYHIVNMVFEIQTHRRFQAEEAKGTAYNACSPTGHLLLFTYIHSDYSGHFSRDY